MYKSWKSGVLGSFMAFMVSGAVAGTITCEPSTQRVATLSSAESCYTAVSLNINDSDGINSLLGTNYDWYKEGELTAAGANDLFTVTADSWGTDVEGTWAIDESFWNMYSTAVITMHVGNGGGDPDAFLWFITPGETSGIFSYERIAGTGGGLSNLLLFGMGTGTQVPETNSILLMLFGLAALVVARNRQPH